MEKIETDVVKYPYRSGWRAWWRFTANGKTYANLAIYPEKPTEEFLVKEAKTLWKQFYPSKNIKK
jgi:hypothetical protein